MPGASAKRAKKDKKVHAEHNKSSEESQSIPKLSVRAYDGPGESSRGTPTSAGGASQGRGRQGSNAPPSVGQPSVRSPSRGPPTQPSVRSPSRSRASSQVRGTSTNLLPDRTALMQAARYVDLPGNAYILGNKVSCSVVGPLSSLASPHCLVKLLLRSISFLFSFVNRPNVHCPFLSISQCIPMCFPFTSLRPARLCGLRFPMQIPIHPKASPPWLPYTHSLLRPYSASLSLPISR